jgi:hypothetical protein
MLLDVESGDYCRLSSAHAHANAKRRVGGDAVQTFITVAWDSFDSGKARVDWMD